MRLGSSVTGTLHIGGESGIAIPASALGSAQGQPAVWVVDPKTQTVSQRSVDVIAHELDRVLLAHGLADGELVVTAGVQSLRPNQQVRLLGGGPGAQGSAAAPAPTDASEPAAKPGAPQ
jgi:multidrug efflux pump subunit AcrA (membrane-fusion protein)